MSAKIPILEYKPQASGIRQKYSVRLLLAYAIILSALAVSVPFHFGSDAPIRHGDTAPSHITDWNTMLHATDHAIAQAASGKNVQFHTEVAPVDQSANANVIAIRYFSAVYSLYPQRVYVGTDDQVINDAKGLYLASEKLPTADWMRQHNISETVFTLLPMFRVKPAR